LHVYCSWIGHGQYKRWQKIQETIGKAEQMLAQECCAKNLDKEIKATKKQINIILGMGK